jgi:hypothetical protein
VPKVRRVVASQLCKQQNLFSIRGLSAAKNSNSTTFSTILLKSSRRWLRIFRAAQTLPMAAVSF